MVATPDRTHDGDVSSGTAALDGHSGKDAANEAAAKIEIKARALGVSGPEMTTTAQMDSFCVTHQPEEGREKVRLKVNSSRGDTTDGLVPQQAGAAVTTSRECVCARACDDGTWWYYQLLA